MGNSEDNATLDTTEWLKKYGGAQKYMYVDPRAGAPYNPAAQTGYGDAQDQGRDDLSQILDVIQRLGFTPQKQSQSQDFSF